MGGLIQSAILTGTSLRGGGITTTAAIIAALEDLAVSRLAAEARLVEVLAADILAEAVVIRLLPREASRPVIRLLPREARRLVEDSNRMAEVRRCRLRRMKADRENTKFFLRRQARKTEALSASCRSGSRSFVFSSLLPIN